MSFKQKDILDLEEAVKAREQLSQKNIAILKAFYNGDMIIIETCNILSGNYEPVLLINPVDFSKATSLAFGPAYTFSEDQHEWLLNYILEKNKFLVQKENTSINLLSDIFTSWKKLF